MIKQHDQRIRELAASLLSCQQIADILEIRYTNLYQYCRRKNISIVKGKRGRKAVEHFPTAREYDMKARYEAGETLQAIGTRYSMTRERVRQLLTNYFGFDRASGGQAIENEANRLARIAQRDAKYLKRWGHDFKTHRNLLKVCRALGRNGIGRERQPIGAFVTQRSSARRRKIKWEYLFAQWWKVWQESGKWDQRGVSGYVMCRFGDAGPYRADNCYIATSGDNIRHYNERRHGNLTEFSTARAA